MSSVNVGNALATGSSTAGSLGTGIDVSSYVSQLVQAQSGPLTQLENEQTTLQNQQSALQTLNTQLQNLYASITPLTDPAGDLNASAATSSDTAILSASAGSGAAAATHTAVVNSLATTSSYYSDEFSSGTATIGTGTFTLQIGNGTPATITVNSSNDTLNGLAATINSENLGVTANVINDSNGARLAIISNTTGASGDLTIGSNTTGFNFTKAVTGANASLTVDGIPISSSSNTVTSVIPSVTLNLASADPNTTVSVSVGADTTDAVSDINNFVSAYNTLMGSLNSAFAVDSSGNGGPLASDTSTALLQTQLLSDINHSMSGNGGITNLASLGVTMNSDGTLSVDNATLTNALQNNLTAVQNFFQGASGSFGQNLSADLAAQTDPTQGLIGLDLNGITQNQQDIGQQITAFESQLNTLTQQLTQQYSQVNVVLEELPLLQSQTASDLSSL